jgi:hypothetical protein
VHRIGRGRIGPVFIDHLSLPWEPGASDEGELLAAAMRSIEPAGTAPAPLPRRERRAPVASVDAAPSNAAPPASAPAHGASAVRDLEHDVPSEPTPPPPTPIVAPAPRVARAVHVQLDETEPPRTVIVDGEPPLRAPRPAGDEPSDPTGRWSRRRATA